MPLFVPLATLAAVSFAAMLYAQTHDGDLAFYMMPFRMFEFAAGAITVLAEQRGEFSKTTALIFGIVGAALVGASLVLVSGSTPWPGLWTLPPVLGTALLIASGKRGLWYWVFSNGLFRYIGRISYSLYLVHWPIIVFYRYYAVTPPTAGELALVGVACLAAAACLHTFVEEPFRYRSPRRIVPRSAGLPMLSRMHGIGRHVRMPVLYALICAVFAGGGGVVLWNGFPSRLDHVGTGLSFAGDRCSPGRSQCAFGDLAGRKTVYVIGDSHALNLIHGLDKLFRAQGIRGVAFYKHGCLFALGTQHFKKGLPDKRCTESVNTAFAYLKDTRDPVIIAGNYFQYWNQISASGETVPRKLSETEYYNWLHRQFEDSLAALSANDRPTILFKQSYVTDVDLAKCVSSPLTGNAPESKCIASTRSEVKRRFEQADRMIDGLKADFPALQVIDPKDVFCKEERCNTGLEAELYLRDTSHLTNAGSEYLINEASGLLLASLQRP